MGSSRVAGDVVLAEFDSAEEPHNHIPKDHRKHRKKKVVLNGDADIVTPYHKDYLSPLPPQGLLVDEGRGVYSSLSSVNNAITVAPSRTNLNDSNVFAGGRPPNLSKRHHRANNNRHHHHKHKGRSRTPDFTSSNHRLRDDEPPHDSQSILNRIDLSIRKNFGDWDCDEEEMAKKLFITGASEKKNGLNKIPYFIPKGVASDSDVTNMKDDVNLPRLFKNYDNVVTSSRQVLNDKSYKIALSRDNADPNSILSQAKKTLNYVSGQS